MNGEALRHDLSEFEEIGKSEAEIEKVGEVQEGSCHSSPQLRQLCRSGSQVLFPVLDQIIPQVFIIPSGYAYRYFSTRSEDYRRKIEDERSRTLYVKDGNGMRHRIILPPSGRSPFSVSGSPARRRSR